MPDARASKKGLIGNGASKLETRTSYVQHYPPPPQTLYTGVSANLGLKARVEGTAAPDPTNLGLGEEGKSFYAREHTHFGEAYKHKQAPEDRARRTNVQPPKDAKVDYTTSYSVWGKKVDLGEGNRPRTSAPKVDFVPPAYGMGVDGESMYTATFHDPKTAPDYLATRIITKTAVEGNAATKMEDYGPLAKSFAHESFQAPPKTAYLRATKPEKDRPRFTIPVGTTKPEDASKYGLGEFGTSLYKDTFRPHTQASRPKTGGVDLGSRVRQGQLKFGKTLFAKTQYVSDFPPPPQSLYTGVSANLGLKARVEGTAAPDPTNLGLGEEGKSFYAREHTHFGEAYKHKQAPEDRARRTNVQPPKDAKVDYTTSYSVWGKKVDLGEGNRPRTSAPKVDFVPPAYGMGVDGESMYTATFHDPKTAPDYLATRIITKTAVEGNAATKMEDYGPLAKSFAHESFQAPPAAAYLQRPRPKQDEKPRSVIPVGTTKPEDASKYGLGHYGKSSYQSDYVNKLGLGVTGLARALNPTNPKAEPA